MSVDESIIQRVFSKIDPDELAHLAVNLAAIISPTGQEREVGDFVLNWFDDKGFHSIKQIVEPERFNAVGVLRGVGGGPSLTLNGHLDTLISTESVGTAYMGDGKVHGHEIANMKAGLATLMIAAKAVKESGVQLRGDLIVATVIGEISTASFGSYQEPQDRGEGVGTRHLVANGVQSDYAIVADGSEYAIIRAQPGVAYFRVTTKGYEYYSPFAVRADKPEKSQNAIIKMTEVIRVIEDWSRAYEKRAIYEFPGGRMEPKSVITVIEGGTPSIIQAGWRQPFDPSLTPPSCGLYLDIRIPPGMGPVRIKHELEEALRGLPFNSEIEMIRSQRGYEGKGPEVDHLCSTIERSYEYVFGSKPPAPSTGMCSMWTDTNIYWEVGIPAVKWGPSEILNYPDRRTAEIEGLVRAAKVYGLVALEVCNKL